MSWFNTLLEVGNLATSVLTFEKVHQIQRQGTQVAITEAFLNELRGLVFKFRNLTEEVLIVEDASPKQLAASIRFLEAQYEQLNLSPDLFLDLYDKEYCAVTSRLLRTSSRNLLRQLSAEERREVDEVLCAMMSMDEPDSMKAVTDFFEESSLSNFFKTPTLQTPEQLATAKIETLLSQLEDTNIDVRKHAVVELGLITDCDSEMQKRILGKLRTIAIMDSNSTLRDITEKSMTSLKTASIETLLSQLEDTNTDVRKLAVTELGLITDCDEGTRRLIMGKLRIIANTDSSNTIKDIAEKSITSLKRRY